MDLIKQKIEILKLARYRIHKRENDFLCETLRVVARNNRDLMFAYLNLVSYIGKELGRHEYLRNWVVHNQPKLDTNYSAMRIYRLKWVDWMIACLEEDLAEANVAEGAA